MNLLIVFLVVLIVHDLLCTRQDCKPRLSQAKDALQKSWICLGRRAAPTDSHGFAAIMLLSAKLNKAKIPQSVMCTNQLPTSCRQQAQLKQGSVQFKKCISTLRLFSTILKSPSPSTLELLPCTFRDTNSSY